MNKPLFEIGDYVCADIDGRLKSMAYVYAGRIFKIVDVEMTHWGIYSYEICDTNGYSTVLLETDLVWQPMPIDYNGFCITDDSEYSVVD